jgi:hypothetical protein
VAGASGRVTEERHETTTKNDSSIGYFAGRNFHIIEYVAAHPEWERQDYRIAARQFVELEINASPSWQGRPFPNRNRRPRRSVLDFPRVPVMLTKSTNVS